MHGPCPLAPICCSRCTRGPCTRGPCTRGPCTRGPCRCSLLHAWYGPGHPWPHLPHEGPPGVQSHNAAAELLELSSSAAHWYGTGIASQLPALEAREAAAKAMPEGKEKEAELTKVNDLMRQHMMRKGQAKGPNSVHEM